MNTKELNHHQTEQQDAVDNVIVQLLNDLRPANAPEIDYFAEGVSEQVAAIRDVVGEALQKLTGMTEMEFYPYIEEEASEPIPVPDFLQEFEPDRHIHIETDPQRIAYALSPEAKAVTYWGNGGIVRGGDQGNFVLLETTSPPTRGAKGLAIFCRLEDVPKDRRHVLREI